MSKKSCSNPHCDDDCTPPRKRSKVVVAGVAIIGLALALSSLAPIMSYLATSSPQPQSATAPLSADQKVEFAGLEAAAQANPKDHTAWITLGNAHFDAGNFPKAAEVYAKALTLSPKNPDVRTDMATALFYQGKSAEAITEYHRAITDAPTHLNAHVNLGIVYRSTGNASDAKAHWSKALGLAQDPKVKEHIQVLLKSVGG